MSDKNIGPEEKAEALRPIPVRHRRHSGSPLTIPTPAAVTAQKEAEVRAAQEKFPNTSPQEREILRKLGFRIERGLAPVRQKMREEAASHPACPSSPDAPEASPTGSLPPEDKAHGPDAKVHETTTASQQALLAEKPETRTPLEPPPTTPILQSVVKQAPGQQPNQPPTIVGSMPRMPPNEIASPEVSEETARKAELVRRLSSSHPVQGFTMAEARALGLV